MANNIPPFALFAITLLCAQAGSSQSKQLIIGTTQYQDNQVDSMVFSFIVQAVGENAQGSMKGLFTFPLSHATLSISELEINNLDSAQYSGLLTLDTFQLYIQNGFVYRGILMKNTEDGQLVDSLMWNFHKSNDTTVSYWSLDEFSKIRDGSGIIIDKIIEPYKVLRYTHHKYYSMGILQLGEAITISTTELLKEGIILSPKASQINIFKESGKIISSISYVLTSEGLGRSYVFNANQDLEQVYNRDKGRGEKMIKIRYRNSVKDLSIKQIVDSFPP